MVNQLKSGTMLTGEKPVTSRVSIEAAIIQWKIRAAPV